MYKKNAIISPDGNENPTRPASGLQWTAGPIVIACKNVVLLK